MPDNKYLWRASVRGVSTPIYLVAQNMQSAQAQASNNPQVDPGDVKSLLRLDLWDDTQNRTVVRWPEPAPPPPPEEPPIP